MNIQKLFFLNFSIFQDDEINLAKSLESNCSQIYSKMFALEKELNLLFTATNINNNNINNNNNDNSSNSEFAFKHFRFT
jgi:hypothetical protein